MKKKELKDFKGKKENESILSQLREQRRKAYYTGESDDKKLLSQMYDRLEKEFKSLSFNEFISEYENQTQKNGKAVFDKILLKDQSSFEVGGLPSLKNIEFNNCYLAYQYFGNLSPDLHETAEWSAGKKIKREDKIFENIAFKNCFLYDTRLSYAKFDNLIMENCNFRNNCYATESVITNSRISGNTKLIQDISSGCWPFFNNCKFQNCDFSNEETIQPTYLVGETANSKYILDYRSKAEKGGPYLNCSFDNVKFASKNTDIEKNK